MPGVPTVFTPTATLPVVSTAPPTPTVPGVNTPTATSPVVNTITPTPVGNTPTATRTVVSGTPTASPTQGACIGDCDNDLQVRINELVLGANIALNVAELSECPEFDEDNDGRAEVNELILGIIGALNGCVGAAAVQQ